MEVTDNSKSEPLQRLSLAPTHNAQGARVRWALKSLGKSKVDEEGERQIPRYTQDDVAQIPIADPCLCSARCDCAR